MSPQTSAEHEIMFHLKAASLYLAQRWADEMDYEDKLEYQLAFRQAIEDTLPQASRCRLQLGRTRVIATVTIYGKDHSIQYNL